MKRLVPMGSVRATIFARRHEDPGFLVVFSAWTREGCGVSLKAPKASFLRRTVPDWI